MYNCGIVTFGKTGHDTNGNWTYFDVPLSPISCVGKSLGAAGGPERVHCHET